jgi:WD40 repeat protein
LGIILRSGDRSVEKATTTMTTESKVCLLSPADLLGYLTFEADCTVGGIEPGLHYPMGEHLRVGDRVTRICDVEVYDRCELRAAISEMHPTVPLDVYFDRPQAPPTIIIDLFASVSYRHAPSAPALAAAAAESSCTSSPRNTNTFDSYADVTLNDEMRCSVPTQPHPMALAEHATESDADEACDRNNQSSQPPPQVSRSVAMSPTPDYLGTSMAASFRNEGGGLISLHNVGLNYNAVEEALSLKMAKAIDSVDVGRAVIIISDQQFSPLDEIESLARTRRLPPPLSVDFGVRIRARISPAELEERTLKALGEGRWLVVLRATKSIKLLTDLAAILDKVDRCTLHTDARVLISAEPHPHFPTSLTHGSKSLRLKSALSQSTLVFESIGTSISVRRFATDTFEPSDSSSQGKRVRMASIVSVVDIEPREVNDAEKPVTKAPNRVNVSGTVTMMASFAALPGDRFYGISFAGGRDRVAVASSLGNLYLTDLTGASLASFHLHDAAVWDVDFISAETFVTGGEDHLACMWSREEDQPDSVMCTNTMRCANDVYCVGHTADVSAIVAGGLTPSVTIRGLMTDVVQHAQTVTSTQAFASVGNAALMVCAGGDGSVSLVDCDRAAVVAVAQQHTKKAAAAASMGTIAITGSYDGKIRLWDTRAAGEQHLQCLKFSQYVTGLAADGNFMTACVGTSLYLWDVRNLSQVLGGHPKAWRDVSRAMCLDAASRTIVTASPDGLTRYWAF